MSKPRFYDAIPKRVIDGDTIDVEVDLGFYTYQRVRLRLLDLNTPELRSKVLEQRQAAHKAKNALQDLVKDKPLRIMTMKTGKYGRWLADIYVGDVLINEVMKQFE